MMIMGIYGNVSVWADIFGTGPGSAMIGFGVAVIVTAVAGFYGAKRDNKCLLLLYFLILCCSFITLVVMGSILIFDNSTFDEQFSQRWDESTEANRVAAQDEFTCCGYASPSDRPAASCNTTKTSVTTGCKSAGLEFMRARFAPLFIFAFVSGCLMFVALLVSSHLLCRSTQKEVALVKASPKATAEMKNLNAFVAAAPVAIEGLPSADTTPLVPDDAGAGGAADDKEAV